MLSPKGKDDIQHPNLIFEFAFLLFSCYFVPTCFSAQEDVDYDDTALEEMLHNAHRVHVHHFQREGLSVGQSSSSVSERTVRPVVERTGRPVVANGQELNVGNAQIRTLLDRQKEQILAECQAQIKKHEFHANYDRRSVQKLCEIIECQQEELRCAQAEELQRRDQQLLHAQLLQQNSVDQAKTKSSIVTSPLFSLSKCVKTGDLEQQRQL